MKFKLIWKLHLFVKSRHLSHSVSFPLPGNYSYPVIDQSSFFKNLQKYPRWKHAALCTICSKIAFVTKWRFSYQTSKLLPYLFYSLIHFSTLSQIIWKSGWIFTKIRIESGAENFPPRAARYHWKSKLWQYSVKN